MSRRLSDEPTPYVAVSVESHSLLTVNEYVAPEGAKLSQVLLAHLNLLPVFILTESSQFLPLYPLTKL